MNNQEIYDKVVSHLRNQKKRSLDDEGLCRYRNNNGLKCSVGILINDSEYDSSLEGKSFYSILKQKNCPKSLFDLADSAYLINDLQRAHDIVTPEFWEDIFLTIAVDHKLIYKEAT